MSQTDFQHLIPPRPSHYIGDEWAGAESLHDVIDPSNERVIAQVGQGDASLADEVMNVAKRAQKHWAAQGHRVRADFLQTLASIVENEAEALARLLVTEQGKPIREARDEVQMALTMLRYYGGFGYRQTGQTLALEGAGRTGITREEPYGVVVAIIPWNFPLAMFTRKLAPALVAGNTIVIKPSEDTPLTSLAMARLCQQAKIPAGVVNVVTGRGSVLGDALVRHPLTSLITMTGSTRAGQQILKAAAERIVPVSLELGGKAPFIVTESADIERAAKDALAARMLNCGQVCICNERTYVHTSVYDAFMEALLRHADDLTIGDPHDETTVIGPKVNASERDNFLDHVARAKSQGAQVAFSGKAQTGSGYWVSPVILTDVDTGADILKEEVFGPVLPVVAYTDVDDVIAWSNASEYGLSAYVYAQHLPTIMKLADSLESGEVYINRIGPEEINGFHAGWKRSGLGGDDGERGYQTYVRTKTLYLDYTP